MSGQDAVLSFEPDRPLVLMHVPKSAGNSMIRALVRSCEPQSSLLAGFDKSMFGASAEFIDCDTNVQKLIYNDANELPQGIDLVATHMAFGTLLRGYPNGQLVTIIREPISRLLSLWVYWRSHTDEQLEPWGAQWGKRLRSSRRRLVEFLEEEEVACQTDNQVTRLLLWPHSEILDGAFIEARHDESLVKQALMRLKQFSFIDFLENANLESNCEKWLARPFSLGRENETGPVPKPLRTRMADELTSSAWELLEARSRLDLALWRAVVNDRKSHSDFCSLRRQIIARAVSRLSVQLS